MSAGFGLLRRALASSVRLALALAASASVTAAALGVLPPLTTLTMVERALVGAPVRRAFVDLDAVSPSLVRAVIAAEDAQFCRHGGIDFRALELAIEEARDGKRRLRGASTISQQTAKNVFLWNGGGFARKAVEAGFTYLIEGLWSKQRIMVVYLNVAEWGDGLFGVEAAAQARFGKSARDLTDEEAALLAAVLPNPNLWRLDPPSDFVRERARTLRGRMRTVAADGLADCVLGY